MFTDANDLADGSTLQADMCVVGSGAAAIALALEFVDASLRVVLVESGGLTAEPDGHGIYKVVAGSPPRLSIDQSRTRYFGGNTNHWAANCRPLDEIDFEPRDWVPHSGWPVRRPELLSYYERAQRVCGLHDFQFYDIEACRPHLTHQPLDVDPAVLTNRVVQMCPTPGFAELYRRRLETADNVRVLVHARALRLKTSAGAGRVQALELVGPGGRRSHVEAGAFVLATGGVENPQLLLSSNDVRRNGLGNDHDLVGRFFMEHWYIDIPLGSWRPAHDLRFYTHQSVNASGMWGQLVLSDAFMRNERAPGLSLWLPLTTSGDPDAVPASGIRRMLRKLKRRVRGGPPRQSHLLRVQLEQVPDPENRIRLSSEHDGVGQPNATLALRLSDDERRAHIRSLELATAAIGLDGQSLARQMQQMIDAAQFDFFWHHMGTTRMHSNPEHGVVDSNCRVHGVANLYVAGSSVFPATGTAAPTLTIVALALRLADHLRGRQVEGRPSTSLRQ